MGRGLIAVLIGCSHLDGLAQVEFPDVPLIQGSQPRFATLALDEVGENRVFVLLDGNVEAEYRRAYVWIPNHPQFGRPMAMTRGEHEFFPPVAVPVPENPVVETTWQIRAWNERHGGHGEHVRTRHDYRTGEVIRETVAARDVRFVPRFDFRVRYRHAGRDARSLASASDPLDVTINGHHLPVGDSWQNRPNPTTPWNNLYLNFTVDQERLETDDNPTGGNLVFRMDVRHHHHGHGRAQFDAIPDSARVDFEVFPYLEDPVFSERLHPGRLLAGGFAVRVPFGWYQYNATFTCEGLRVHPHSRDVFPFTKR